MARVDFITTTADVEALARRLGTSRRLALDTEFHAERRYRPQLLLLQLAADDGAADGGGLVAGGHLGDAGHGHPADGGVVHVIDPTCCELGALAPLVDGVEWVVHGGQHDVGLLAEATGCWPTRVFDTQRAAALVGLPYPMRLDTLMKQRLGIDVPASQALSNWKQRPLSPEQIAYAAADVALLLDLADDLDAELAALDRQALARAASLDLVAEAQAPPRDLDAWRRWAIAPNLSDDERRVVARLARWRDDRAQDRQQPPHYLLGDSLMLALARSQPGTPADLAADRRVGSGLRKRHGADLLAVIAEALAGPAPAPVSPDVPARVDLLRAWIHAHAAEARLGAGLLLPPGPLQDVAERGPEALVGWRRDLLHAPLSALWEGSATIGLDSATGRLSVRRDKPWPAGRAETP